MSTRRLTALILATICVIITPVFFHIPSARATTATYAKILPNAHLYTRQTNGVFTQVTTLPHDYFVLVIDQTDPTFLSAAYHDLLGFVRRDSVQLVTFEPVTKSALGSLIGSNGGLGFHLRELPDHTLPNPVWLPADTLLDFYGTINGTVLHPLLGTTWYFVRFVDNGTALFGYVYGGHVQITSPIPPNIIEEVGGGNNSTVTTHRRPFGLDPVRQGIVVGCLAIAALFVILALYRPAATDKHRTPRYKIDK